MNSLKEILKRNSHEDLFPCIKDIISNGVKSTSSPSGHFEPNRQDVTQFLIFWFKYIGISLNQCQDWMIDYAVRVLSQISSSSHSKIKHSTKSNLKYIFKSDKSFSCECENNIVKAYCSQDCRLYREMLDKYKEELEKKAEIILEATITKNEPIVKIPTLKESYREQFDKAMETASDYLEKGYNKREILEQLIKSDFKTKTGKNWTYSTLVSEFGIYRKNQEKSKLPS